MKDTNVVDKLKALEPGAPAEVFRAAAMAVVDLRSKYEHEGLPDWSGRSAEYRAAIEERYRLAEVPPDSENNVQAKLRYHIGNVLREVAPPGHLEQLGMAPKGPRGRAVDHRAEVRPTRVPAEARRARVDNPVIVVALALDSLRLIGAMEIEEGDVAIVRKMTKDCLDEAVSVLSGL